MTNHVEVQAATGETEAKANALEVERSQDDMRDDISINEAARGDNLPPGYFYSAPFLGTLVALILGLISTYVIFVMSINVLTYTNTDIGPSKNISWVSIARTLGQSAMFLIQGRLSDLFGRRWFFIGGSFIALVGVIISATAPNVDVLIGGSVIYGMGECVQISYGVAIGELVPNKFRPVIMAIITFSALPFAAFGPVIARTMIVKGLGWRWVYYLGIIVIGVATGLLFLFYHPPTFHMLHERKSMRQQLAELDYIGMALWTAGLCLFLLGISWGGGLYAWNSVEVLTTLIIGVVLLIIFGLYESYANLKYPVMPMSLFRNRGYISLVAAGTIAFMFYYSATLLWPQQVAAMYTTDIMYGGWLSCTIPAGIMTGTGMGGLAFRYGGNTKYWIIGASVAMVAFVSALAALTPQTKVLGVVLTIFGPFMVGVVEMAAVSISPLFCHPEDLGLATGMMSSIRSAGAGIAVAVYTTILTNRLTTTVTATVGPAAVKAGMSPERLPALVAAVKASTWTKLPWMTPALKAAIAAEVPTAYGQAFKTVYLASLAFGGIGIIGSLFTLDARPYLTDKVERRLHSKSVGGELKTPPPKDIEL